MAIIAAVEAGGTKFICGLGTEDGKIIDRINIPTTTPEETMSKVIEYFKDKEFDVMGVGSFGPIDPVKDSETYGYITKTPKVYWSDYNIIGELKKHYDVPMEFDTDVRRFEWTLLTLAGYALDLQKDSAGCPVEANQQY